jgi:uncharacterized protein (DUF305 family)
MNATRPVIAAGVALVAALAFAGCTAGGGNGGNGGMDGMDHDGTAMRQTDGADEANQADIMFAQMMIPHHQQAIEMSEIILAKGGVDPDVVELAEQIKAAQAPEIEQMESWLDDWGAPSMMDGDSGDMGGMGMNGMLSDDEIDALEAADGATGTTLFLEGMIEHPEGAIDMAEQHQRNGENEAELELSASIITSQTAEIERMQELLAR